MKQDRVAAILIARLHGPPEAGGMPG